MFLFALRLRLLCSISRFRFRFCFLHSQLAIALYINIPFTFIRFQSLPFEWNVDGNRCVPFANISGKTRLSITISIVCMLFFVFCFYFSSVSHSRLASVLVHSVFQSFSLCWVFVSPVFLFVNELPFFLASFFCRMLFAFDTICFILLLNCHFDSLAHTQTQSHAVQVLSHSSGAGAATLYFYPYFSCKLFRCAYSTTRHMRVQTYCSFLVACNRCVFADRRINDSASSSTSRFPSSTLCLSTLTRASGTEQQQQRRPICVFFRRGVVFRAWTILRKSHRVCVCDWNI